MTDTRPGAPPSPLAAWFYDPDYERLPVTALTGARNGLPESSYAYGGALPEHPGLCNDCGRLVTSKTHAKRCAP
jgi:hypothetical protein